MVSLARDKTLRGRLYDELPAVGGAWKVLLKGQHKDTQWKS